MAISEITTIKRYLGLSTDTKPTGSIPVGSTLFELDTGDLYVHDGVSDWLPSNPSLGSSIARPVTATLTRPSDTSAYLAGDVIYSSTGTPGFITFSNVSRAGKTVDLIAVRMSLNITAIPTGMNGFFLHIFSSNVSGSLVDNTPMTIADANMANYCGFVPLNKPKLLGATAVSMTTGLKLPCKLAAASTTLYGILQTGGAYSPTNGCIHRLLCTFADL